MAKINPTGLIIPKILMMIGAIWIMVFAVAIAISKDENAAVMYGLKISWPLLLFLGLVYILIPFSVKVGIWSLVWGALIATLSIIILIGSLIDVDYKSIWTYFGAAPYAFLAVGSVLWTLTSFKTKK